MADILFTIQNTGAPKYKLFYRLKNSANPWAGPFTITASAGDNTLYTVQDVAANEYEYYFISVCSDESESENSELFYTFPKCLVPTGLNVYESGNNFIVEYSVPGSVGQIGLRVKYPNGGSLNNVYTVDSSGQLVIPKPLGQYGDFLFAIRSVCNQSTAWYSDYASEVLVTVGNPSACPPPEITGSAKIGSVPTGETWRFSLGGYTSSVRVVVDNNTTGGQQILTQVVSNNYVDLFLLRSSINYTYTIGFYNLCQVGADQTGDAEAVIVNSTNQGVSVAGWTVTAGPESQDLNNDGVYGTMVTVNTNGVAPSATRDTRVTVRFNCTGGGYAYAGLTIAAGMTVGYARDFSPACTIDTTTAFINSADLQ